jgi:RNA polymerase sigma factor (sigma-70 family)
MTENMELGLGDGDPRIQGAVITAPEVDAWFEREVLPLEAALMQFLQHNWRNESDIADIRQDIYVRVYEAALREIPASAKSFVFAAARNLLINKMRDAQVVPFEVVADVEALGTAIDEPSPDSTVIARDELKRLQIALDRLPPRCREAFVMRQVDGLSHRDIAVRMGLTERTVRYHVKEGLRILANALYGEQLDMRRPS